MTYWEYHYIFTLPLLFVLVAITLLEVRKKPLAGNYRPENRWALSFYFLLPLIALIYTTPWDNYLIYKGVWQYPPERVSMVIGYVPIEEYFFFLVQPLIAGLWLFFLLRRWGEPKSGPAGARLWGTVFWLALSFIGAGLLFTEAGYYMGLILAWACPVIAFQWAFGGDLILSNRRAFWIGLMVPTAYLWITDYLAIVHFGIWDINTKFSFALKPFGLPIEEATFFLITNLLVVQGLLLFLHPQALPRWFKMARSLKPWTLFVALFALLKIPVPLWPDGFPLLATLSTGSLAIAAFLFAYEHIKGKAFWIMLLTFGMGLGIEVLGSRTGFPFGQYTYDPPGITLLGVPIIVPLGWWAMTLSAYLLAKGNPWLTGLYLVVWDVGLEPLMIREGYWSWQEGQLWSAYYGVPAQNFLAWYVMGVVLAFVVRKLAPELKTPDFAWAYRIEALFLPTGLILLGMYPAGLITMVLMGGLAWLQFWKSSSKPLSAAPLEVASGGFTSKEH